MYYPYFLAYIVTGFSVSFIVFIWALNNGQFSDQNRARYIPLEDMEAKGPYKTQAGKLELYGLFILAAMGLSATAAVLVVALLSSVKP